jgi:hypothetical protein
VLVCNPTLFGPMLALLRTASQPVA